MDMKNSNYDKYNTETMKFFHTQQDRAFLPGEYPVPKQELEEDIIRYKNFIENTEIVMEKIQVDENSTEERDLFLRGINIGKYTVGLWSRWYNAYWKKHNDFCPPLDLYICRKLHEDLKMDMRTADDVLRVSEYCKALRGMTLIEYAVSVMESEIKELNI